MAKTVSSRRRNKRTSETADDGRSQRAAAGARVRERRRPTQERAAATVEAILQAAAELICDLGYAAASTNRIAARAGVSIGSLYQYFADKAAILARLQEDHHREVHEVVEAALPDLADPAVPVEVGLRRLLEDLVELHDRDPNLTRALASEVPHPKALAEEGAGYAARVESLLTARPDVRAADLPAASALVVTTLEALTRWLVHEAPERLDRGRLAGETAAMLGGYLSGGGGEGPRFRPIGVVRTPFESPEGMPIQPSRAGGARGRVVVDPEYAPGLADLDGFSHVILLCHLHRARPHRLRVVPFLDDEERGLFATRSPSRPNPIGLSVVRLVAVEGAELTVEGVDLLDGTPLLDLKPWIGEVDPDDEVRLGWLEAARGRAAMSDGRFGE